MKNSLMILFTALSVLCSSTGTVTAHAAHTLEDYAYPQRIRATCYTQTGITKSGQYTRQGILAGKEEWLGHAAVLYAVNEDGSMGEIIGIYEFLDTGGTKGLKNGTVIDVWVDGENGLNEWIKTYGDYVYLQIVPAQG